jgi:uncharacterized protein (UPF0276 family)
MMAKRSVVTGLSYMYEQAFNRAILPLLEAGEVEALEWSFDTVSDPQLLPEWQQNLLKAYADAGRLYGHGVYYSLLNGNWSERQRRWLRRFASIQEKYPFRHVSEHFGFMSSSDAHRGCPLPVPLTEATLSAGRQRLRALHDAAQCPVGIENLALAFSRNEVLGHGAFLEQLAAPIGGFVVLDLHNIYCQSHNFGLDMRELIRSYPLERVREIHVSGGSWAATHELDRSIRRDTHDDRIPEAVFDQLGFAVAHCPNLDLVIVERLGDTFESEADEAMFRGDYLQVKAIVRETANERPVPHWPFIANADSNPGNGIHPELLRQQQLILKALAGADTAGSAKSSLVRNAALSDWRIESWDPEMIDTAMQLGRRWGIDLEE